MKTRVSSTIRAIFRRCGLEVRRAKSGVGRDHEFDHTFVRLAQLRDLGFSPTSVCDVGASDGKWTLECLKLYPEAGYFCIEPLEANRERLIKLKSKHPNVDYWHGCLGAKSERAILNVDGDGSSILRGHYDNPYGTPKEVKVEMLDNLVAQGICPQPNLIKLDVQGYEIEVMRGAAETLNTTRAVITEVSFIRFQSGMPLVHEVVKQLCDFGFVVSDVLSLSLRPLDQMAGQADLLFLKDTDPLRSSHSWARDSVY